MFNRHKIVSAYLVEPSSTHGGAATWNGFRTQFFEIKRANPRILKHSFVVLALWVAIVASIQSLTQSSGASSAASSWSLATATGLVSSRTTAPTAAPGLVSAVRASILPGGPSGQLLPPGTMTPDRTYTNSYARGQCTWYVAGRRPIPAGWGNAGSWYYHAAGSGWKVGTVPALAAVAWTSAGYYGHVALVEQISTDGKSVYVSEMNYRGVGVKSFRWAPASSFKYIY
jgi:hypothetical protein